MEKRLYTTIIIVSIICWTASAQETQENKTGYNGGAISRPYTPDIKPLTPERVREHSVRGLGFKKFTTANGTAFYVTSGGDVVEHLTTTTTLTTIRVMKEVCGGTDLYCSVEYDMTNDGRKDCCSQDNNPTCNGCLEKCKSICAKNYYGVKTCFMDNGIPRCDCTRNLPTCYKIDLTDAPPEVKAQEASGTSTIWYIILFLILLIGMSLAVKFANRIL